MKWFRRKPKVEPTTEQVETVTTPFGEFGEISVTVDRSGEVPQATVTIPPKLAVGALLDSSIRERGQEHPETLELAHRYALILADEPADRKQAIELLEWLSDVRLGDPAKRLPVLNDLSRVLQDAGHLSDAEETYRQALSGWERLRGQNDENTLSAANNLAIVLVHLDRHDEAEGLLRDTVARRTRTLGATHVDTVTSRNALAGTLRGTPGRLAEAERMYRAILADLARNGDPGDQAHISRHNLAAVLFHLNKLGPAEEMFRQVLAERSRVLGDQHPDVLTTRNSLAAVLSARGKAGQAERETAAVLEARRRVLGRRHPETLDSQVNLAAIRANQGRVAEALPLLEDAIEGLRAAYGAGHPMVQELQQVRAQLRAG
ncbi:tetratricopeptide repeat protein [Actinoplanes sp. NEAU-A12]|uniref:Tetratricopeptide repeat protein n=1 Tax=Actinoplanes sandaracinus TaxID=3045177 RepID=A0ABT6WWG1_9ACTN|nr:tetratricopeptide repeat protein [Actinoplanes sandaracinus]MDI6104087.1 tetratricopeptide repeat protein [Actinoplanes sandaracinus]